MMDRELEFQISELKRVRTMTGLNRTQFCKQYGIPLRSMEQWEAGQRKMPEYVLRLLSYKVLSERVLGKQQYYDSTTSSDCIDAFTRKGSVIPAGTTVYSMPPSDNNDEYRMIREEYDLAFIFEPMKIEYSFYSVPRFDIMAVDSRGGYIGMLGSICDLQDGRPVYYIDENRNTYMIAATGQEFIQNMSCWREKLKPTNDMILFDSKTDAEQIYSFIDMSIFETEGEGIHDK